MPNRIQQFRLEELAAAKKKHHISGNYPTGSDFGGFRSKRVNYTFRARASMSPTRVCSSEKLRFCVQRTESGSLILFHPGPARAFVGRRRVCISSLHYRHATIRNALQLRERGAKTRVDAAVAVFAVAVSVVAVFVFFFAKTPPFFILFPSSRYSTRVCVKMMKHQRDRSLCIKKILTEIANFRLGMCKVQ